MTVAVEGVSVALGLIATEGDPDFTDDPLDTFPYGG